MPISLRFELSRPGFAREKSFKSVGRRGLVALERSRIPDSVQGRARH